MAGSFGTDQREQRWNGTCRGCDSTPAEAVRESHTAVAPVAKESSVNDRTRMARLLVAGATRPPFQGAAGPPILFRLCAADAHLGVAAAIPSAFLSLALL